MDRDTKLFIKDLTVKTKKGFLCVRIMRKWNYDGNIPGGPVLYVGLILADEQGQSIYAQIPEDEVERLGSQLLLDNVYTIRKFNVRIAKPGYVPFDAELMIQITSFTTITPSKTPVDLFPKFIYKIMPFNQIKTGGEKSSRYIDILGILTAEEAPKTACPRGKDYVSTLKELTIKDLSGTELTVTLWEDHVHQFKLPTTSSSEPLHSVVILFCGCLPKRVFNKTQVNVGNACRWFINPDIQEAQPLYASLRARPVPIRRPLDTTSAEPSTVKPAVMEHKMLAEMNALDPYEFPEEGYKCTVSITEIPPDQEWWYMGCEVCKKRLRNYGGKYYCAKCKCDSAVPLYKFTFTAADATADAKFFCYDVVARQIIRRNCDSLLRTVNNAPGLPDQMVRAIGRTFTFAVGLTDQSYHSMNNRVYLIDSSTFKADPNMPPMLYASSSQTSSEIVPHKDQNVTASEIVNTPAVQAASSSICQTPPPTEELQKLPEKETITISATKDGTEEPQLPGSNVRKRLFTETESSTKETVADAFDAPEIGTNVATHKQKPTKRTAVQISKDAVSAMAVQNEDPETA